MNMNYWADYERILAVLMPVKRVLRAVRNFDPQGKKNSTRKEAVKLIKNFMEVNSKFYEYAATGNYMAQLLLLTNVHWSKRLHSAHLCLNMNPTILGIAPTQAGAVMLKMPVMTRYKMLSDPVFMSKRISLYKSVAVLHKNDAIFTGARWGNTPHGWIYPGAAAKDILNGLAARWSNMANLINEREMESIILPHESIWMVQRCFQEHRVRLKLAKCERILVKKLAEMMFGKDCHEESAPLAVPRSSTLLDGSLLTFGLPAVFNAKVKTLSFIQLGLFNQLKISAALPSVSWSLGLDGPHPVSREKLLIDKAS